MSTASMMTCGSRVSAAGRAPMTSVIPRISAGGRCIGPMFVGDIPRPITPRRLTSRTRRLRRCRSGTAGRNHGLGQFHARGHDCLVCRRFCGAVLRPRCRLRRRNRRDAGSSGANHDAIALHVHERASANAELVQHLLGNLQSPGVVHDDELVMRVVVAVFVNAQKRISACAEPRAGVLNRPSALAAGRRPRDRQNNRSCWHRE